MGPSFLGSLAILALTIAGLLFMVGARSLAGRALRTALLFVVLGCFCPAGLRSVQSIDLRTMAVPAALGLVGLLGFLHLYLYFKRRKERHRLDASVRHCAPEAVPELLREEKEP